MDVSVVIPCHQSEPSLKLLIGGLRRELAGLGLSYEIVLVQDSVDRHTRALLDQLSAELEEVSVIRLSKNFGQQAATVAGILGSSGKYVVTLDDDSQHRPEDVTRMVLLLESDESVELVYGRSSTQSHSRTRFWLSEAFRRVLRWSGLRFAGSFSPLRAFRGSFRRVFEGVPGPNVSVDVCLSWVANRVVTVDCEFKYLKDGKSTYTRWKLLRVALQILLFHTTAPLLLGILLGTLGVTVAIAYGSWLLASYFATGNTPPGFATIALLIVFLSSIQILLIGVIGLYLGQLYSRNMGRPAFFVLAES